MPLQHTGWTAEMVNTLPDDGSRYEVIDGELFVTPAPSIVHQRAATKLLLLLAPFTEALKLDLLTPPTAVRFSMQREVQPDVLVLPRKAGRLVFRFEDVGVLILAVEILSPHTARTDRLKKRMLYQNENVPEYWIIDTESRSIERWRPESQNPEVLTTTLSWRPDPAAAALTIDIVQYFRSIWDD